MLPGNVANLESYDQTVVRLGIPIPSVGGTEITFPGFPARTLRYIEVTAPTTRKPFTKGRLIADGLRQIVGIQWSDDQPTEQMLPDDHVLPKWSIMDPIVGRIRKKSFHRVGHRTCMC